MAGRKSIHEGKTMLKFSLVGVLNTAVDYGVFATLTGALAWPVAVAHTASVALATANSYLWNRNWTFRSGQRPRTRGSETARILRFVGLNLVSFGVSLAVVVGLSDGLHWYPWLAKAPAIVVSLALNYLGNRLWVFPSDSPVPPRESTGIPGPGKADGS